MAILSEHDLFIFAAQLGIIILAARIFGELAKKFKQPVIVGEVFAGILLGPCIFGKFFPGFHDSLFSSEGAHSYLLQGISWFSIVFLLLITGLEIDIRASIRQGKQSLLISLVGLGAALVGIYFVARFLPPFFYPENIDPLHVNLFVTVALSVVAIPIITKILYDFNILRSAIGVNILSSGVLSDIWGWTIHAIVISLVTAGSVTVGGVLKPLITIIIYLALTLTYGSTVIDWLLNFFGYKKLDTTMALSLLFAFTLLNGAIAYLLGIHVIFGAFVAGVMAGESDKVTPYIREWVQDFVFAVFAPIFFVLIGMQLEFTSTQIWIPVIVLLLASSVLRIGGAFLGGIWAGLGRKNALTVACGLNTQGTMGIIVALIALELGVFNSELFSTIVMICVLTSLGVGPLLKWALNGVKRPLAKYFGPDQIFLDVEGESKEEVIKGLTVLMHERKIIEDEAFVQKAIWERENVMSTAIGEGVALPHARLPNLKEPVLCFFRLKNPVDFNSPDNKPVRLLFLELTDRNDDGMQLNFIAQIARFISSVENRSKLLKSQNAQEINHMITLDEKV